MLIRRTIPPAAAPIHIKDVFYGLRGLLRGQEELDRFNRQLKGHFDAKHCFLVSSGKAALSIVLGALHDRCPQRNEVLIPAFTCFSVPSSIVRAGLKVKLCDVNAENFDFDRDHLSSILDSGEKASKLLAVVAVHLFGLPSNVDGLRARLPDPQITVIEDASQSLGNSVRKGKLGTFGDVAIFSLGRGKPFSTVEGGIILTNNDNLAEHIQTRFASVPLYTCIKAATLFFKALVLSVFTRPSLFWLPKSLPFIRIGETIFDTNFKIQRFSPFQAGLAARWESKLTEFRRGRAVNSILWRELLSCYKATRVSENLENLSGSIGPLRFPVRIDDKNLRKDILEKSRKHGLGIMPGYPHPVNEINELSDCFHRRSFPGAKQCAAELITLPVHTFLSPRDRYHIARLLTSGPDFTLNEYQHNESHTVMAGSQA